VRTRRSHGAIRIETFSTPASAATTNKSSATSSPIARQPIDTLLPCTMMSPPRSVRPSSLARARSNAFG
jgi:hypothetical protein